MIENVEKASIRIENVEERKTAELIACYPQKNGALCSITPTGTLIRAEILIADKVFPIDIQSIYKTKNDCCKCGYYDLIPSRVTIPYR